VRSIDPTAEDAPPPYQGAPGADEKMAIKTISTLFVKTVDGRNLVLENLAITMKVSELREKIRSEKYIDVAGVRILFGGKELEDRKLEYVPLHDNEFVLSLPRTKALFVIGMSLMDYNLGNVREPLSNWSCVRLILIMQQESTVHIVYQVHGGHI